MALINKDERLPIIIAQTRDYDRFNYLATNREVDGTNKRNLMASMELFPELIPFQPILVNENWFILDGQHRFEDLRDAGAPITYIMAPGLGVAHARQVNITGKKWVPADYARSYAKEGREDYQIYLNMRKEYAFEHGTTVIYLGGGQKHRLARKFIAGDFKVRNEQKARQYFERLDALFELMLESGYETRAMSNGGAHAAKKLHRPLATALHVAFEKPEFDWLHFIARFEERHKAVLYASGRTSDYLRMIEIMYNHNLKGKANLYLI